MKKNMGSIDKLVRIIVAIVLIALFTTGKISGITGIVLLALSAIFILTSFISFCPLYRPLGINTCKKKWVNKKRLSQMDSLSFYLNHIRDYKEI